MAQKRFWRVVIEAEPNRDVERKKRGIPSWCPIPEAAQHKLYWMFDNVEAWTAYYAAQAALALPVPESVTVAGNPELVKNGVKMPGYFVDRPTARVIHVEQMGGDE